MTGPRLAGWCIALVVTAVAAGLLAHHLLAAWPAAGGLPPWRGATARDFADLVATSNILAWPFAVAGGATYFWFGGSRWMLALLEGHLAVFVIWLGVASQFFPPDGLDTLLTGIALLPEALLYAACRVRHQPRLGWVAPAFCAACLAGASVGVHAWSAALPGRIQRAAEAAAGGENHCIVVGQRRVTDAAHLTAGAMMPLLGEWKAFHALLVVGQGHERRILNWSFRSGSFQPVSDQALQRVAIYPRPMDQMDWCDLPPPFATPQPPYVPRALPAPQRITPRPN